MDYGFAPIGYVEYPKYYPFTKKPLCPNSTNFFPPVLDQKVQISKRFKVDAVYTVKDLEGIKYALSNNLPVILAMEVPKSFENLKSKLWNPYSYETKVTGSGHAVVAIGYDDNLFGGAIRIANSWGENWGDKGKAWIHYSDLIYWLDGGFLMQKSGRYGAENKAKDSSILVIEKEKDLKPQTFKVAVNHKKTTYTNKKLIEAFTKRK